VTKKETNLSTLSEAVSVATSVAYTRQEIQKLKKEFTSLLEEKATEVIIEQVPGPVGPRGALGATGAQGSKGDKGDKGDVGERGEKGDVGQQGEIGPEGPQGIKGDKGDTGEVGPQGIAGERGPQGLKGDRGEDGKNGLDGRDGKAGEIGPIGLTGQQGIQGERGAKGDTGEKGERGERGERGENGRQGIQGSVGPRGEIGPQGIQGIPGKDGKDADIKPVEEKFQKFIDNVQKDVSAFKTKVNAAILKNGPNDAWKSTGSGEVNLRYLDDVDRDSITDGYVLSYDDASKKFVFVEQSGGGGGTVDNIARTRATNAWNTANLAYLQANSAFSTANASYIQANTGTTLAQAAYNYANTISLAGYAVNTTVNLVWSTANNAYAEANSALSIAQSAFAQANTGGAAGTDDLARSIANSAFNQANTATSNAATANNQAASAFSKANTATTLAQSAYDFANTIVSDTQIDPLARSISNSAFAQANTATTNAATANNQAASAFLQANSALSIAQSAFAQANTGGGTDNVARSIANSAFSTANSAFAKANTGTSQLVNGDSIVSLSANGNLTLAGPISGLGNAKLDFTTYGANAAYLTTTGDDSTALFMGLVSAELYAHTNVQIRANTGGVSQNWTFNEDGTLTFPDSTVQTTAATNSVTYDQNLNTSNTVSFAGVTVTGNTTVQHVIPSANVTYDLGRPTARFRDLYLSGNTINLGGAQLSANGSTINLPPQTKVGNKNLTFEDISTITLDTAITSSDSGLNIFKTTRFKDLRLSGFSGNTINSLSDKTFTSASSITEERFNTTMVCDNESDILITLPSANSVTVGFNITLTKLNVGDIIVENAPETNDVIRYAGWKFETLKMAYVEDRVLSEFENTKLTGIPNLYSYPVSEFAEKYTFKYTCISNSSYMLSI